MLWLNVREARGGGVADEAEKTDSNMTGFSQIPLDPHSLDYTVLNLTFVACSVSPMKTGI